MARMHIAHTAPLTNPRVREAEAHRSPALRFQLRACKSITTLEQFMELDELQRRKILSPDKFTVDQLKEVDEFLQRYPKLEVPPDRTRCGPRMPSSLRSDGRNDWRLGLGLGDC